MAQALVQALADDQAGETAEQDCNGVEQGAAQGRAPCASGKSADCRRLAATRQRLARLQCIEITKRRTSLTAQRLLLILLLLGAIAPLTAQPDGLVVSDAPPRDRVELARRVFGLEELPAPPAEAPDWRVGDALTFHVTNEEENRRFPVTATLRAGGERIWLWVQQDVEIDEARLQALAQLFDDRIYGPLRALFGSENSPGVDGDPRVYALFTRGLGQRVAGYFSSEHSWPRAAVASSNQREMFIFNLDVLGPEINVLALGGLAAHEFQHMIQAHQDLNENVWLNEGFSGFAELHTGSGFGTDAEANAFMAWPGTQLNTWPEAGNTFPHYGAGLLLVTYFHDRFGPDALRRLSQHPAPGLVALEALLGGPGEPGVDVFFADWVLANLLRDTDLADGRFGYRSPLALRPPALAATIDGYPFARAASLAQYASDYLQLNRLQGAQSLEIALDLPGHARLAPTAAASGQRLWYSGRQDNSDATLTRRFDLRGLSAATLEFSLWHHTEELWDYGHVLLSADGGSGWQLLESAAMSRENPHHNALGPGYTGRSDGWLRERIPLDAWAGQEVLLRFELLTDDAITQPGLLLDDVSIPQLGYHSDFEADDGGWQGRGWVWSDNRVPQRLWLQAVTYGPGDPKIERWLVTESGVWTLPLQPDTTQVDLALSPMAALTTEAANYELRLSLR